MKPRIFIDAGGWYLAYYMGMWEYILEHFGREAFKGVYFDGISAGGHVATHIIASVYSDKPMKTWLETGPKTAVKNEKYSIGCLVDGVHDTGYDFYDNLNKTQRRAMRKYVRVFCTDTFFTVHYCDKLSNAHEYAKAVSATGNIPIFSSYTPTKFRDKYLWDGGLNKNTYSLVHKKSLCISFTPCSHCDSTLDLSNWIYYTQLVSLMPSFLPQKNALFVCDKLFEQGYNDAKSHRDELLTKFQGIGINL